MLAPLSLVGLTLSENDALTIGKKIWRNECNETMEGLISWNAGEEFASLGIGHFIWYPTGKESIFTETFPDLLLFLKTHHITLPYWLNPKTKCPWRTKAEFDKDQRGYKRNDLLRLLSRTVSLQAQFMASRFAQIEDKLLDSLTQSEQKHVQEQLSRLSATPEGQYALLDYLNFKGDGLNPKERYQGRGWGLQQALLLMPGNTNNPLEEFARSAERLLTDRVELSPPERNEKRWLNGWLKRLLTYKL